MYCSPKYLQSSRRSQLTQILVFGTIFLPPLLAAARAEHVGRNAEASSAVKPDKMSTIVIRDGSSSNFTVVVRNRFLLWAHGYRELSYTVLRTQ